VCEAAICNALVDIARVESILLCTSSRAAQDVAYDTQGLGRTYSGVDMEGNSFKLMGQGTVVPRRNTYKYVVQGGVGGGGGVQRCAGGLAYNSLSVSVCIATIPTSRSGRSRAVPRLAFGVM
jgi:hypothetical protein